MFLVNMSGVILVEDTVTWFLHPAPISGSVEAFS